MAGPDGPREGANHIELVLLGRGGQGAFTAARVLGRALLASGWNVLVWPSFGPERRGAPVQAFVRAERGAVQDRGPVSRPDWKIVLDASLDIGQDAHRVLVPENFPSKETPPHPQDKTAPVKRDEAPSEQESSWLKQERAGSKQESSWSKQERAGSKQESSWLKQERAPSEQESSHLKQETAPSDQEFSWLKQEQAVFEHQKAGLSIPEGHGEGTLWIPALELARIHLGSPHVNIIMASALWGIGAWGDFAAFSQAVEAEFGSGAKASKNNAAAHAAFDWVKTQNLTHPSRGDEAVQADVSAPQAKAELNRPFFLDQGPAMEARRPGSNKALRSRGPRIDASLCTACGLCSFWCPDAALEAGPCEQPRLDGDWCKGCGICVKVCPRKAVSLVHGI